MGPRVAEFLERHSGKLILAAVALTLLLCLPLLALESDEAASRDPAGEVFDLQRDIDRRFEHLIHGVPFIVESRSGDILTQAALWELYQNTQALREADASGALRPEGRPDQPYLYPTFAAATQRPVIGVTTLADAVQQALGSGPGPGVTLADATDEQVKLAVHYLFARPEASGLKGSLSVAARSERRVIGGQEIDYWTSPALVFTVLADNQKLGGGPSRAGIRSDETALDKEEFNRNVQRVLRGQEQTYRLWGIAIDQNLEAQDQGRTAGVFIMLAVVAAVVVVGASLRSYWATALTGVGLGALMVWLKGISNLVGIKGDLVITLIVPIAMVSLGVDFAVHALRRYQDEKAAGYPPQRAFIAGFAGVLAALTLAMFSDGIAFLANVSSGIEAVVHFGAAAGIAVASSFVVLGVVVPLAMMRLDRLRVSRNAPTPPAAQALALAGGLAVAGVSGAAVILLVAVSAVAGILLLLATAVGFLAVPALVMGRRGQRPAGRVDSPSPQPGAYQGHPEAAWLAQLVTGLARYRLPVLAAMAGMTAASVFFALRLDATFDVEDFFDHRSDFVVSLDKLDEHISQRSGEPGVIYISGDLADPEALASIRRLVDRLGGNPYVGRNPDGSPSMAPINVLRILELVTASDYARDRVAQETGVRITDAAGNGLPDSREQVRAVYGYVVRQGVPLDESALVYDSGQVLEVLFHDPAGNEEDVTVLMVGLPGTREQATVKAARPALERDLEVLRQSPAITRAGLTGSPFLREAQLDATTDTLQRSLPIAAAATLALLALAMRSLRYAVVTVIPIGLVVAWLYGLMYLIGFSLNFVTATIGAVSVGVGIDYSIHMAERFREELRRAASKMEALRRAATGTGAALLASAGSSIVGFTIMGFAPMPTFSSFGFLTALMIFLALVASLVVLPSLLLLVTPEKRHEVAAEGAPAD